MITRGSRVPFLISCGDPGRFACRQGGACARPQGARLPARARTGGAVLKADGPVATGTCREKGEAVLLASEKPMHLNARSPLAGRAHGCTGRGCGGCGFPVARHPKQTGGISPLKPRRG